MHDGSTATYDARHLYHGGKVYVPCEGPIHIAPEGTLGKLVAGRLVVCEAGDACHCFREARAVEIPIRDGGVATYLEGDEGVSYMGQFYDGFVGDIATQPSHGWMSENETLARMGVLLIQTQATGSVETLFFYRRA